jgi:phosphate starvation-inducible PhoH-like protein
MRTTCFALEDTSLLAEICGVNDYNLKVLSRAVGSEVFCRGNELYVETATDGDGALFLKLLDELVASAEEGLKPTPDLILAIASALTPEGDLSRDGMAEFRDTWVQVPGGYGKVYARGKGQAAMLREMQTKELVFAVGPAGTGKTFLAVAWALREVLSKAKRKLVITRPVVEAGESLGFLPGDLEQKIGPYLRPVYDAMESIVPYETLKRLEDARSIEVAPLAYMRGRSLNNCCVILDEAQNATKEQMKMFLTRLGEGSKAIVTGDDTQVDLPRKTDSGLIHAIGLLSSTEGVSVCRLESRDVVRSPLVKRIIEAYEIESR